MGPMAKRASLLLVLSLVAQTHACSSTNETIAQGAGAGGGGAGGSSNADANPGSGGSDAGGPAGGGSGGSSGSAPVGTADAAMDRIGDASAADTTDAKPGPGVADAMIPDATLPPGIPDGYKLLLDESFASAGSLAAILAGNPADWTHGTDGGGYLQYGGVGYTPPDPPGAEVWTSFALVSAMKFGSFVLEVELMQRSPGTAPQIDMCIAFGITSEAQYYQAHIAQGHTDRWHNIHIINNAPRRAITKTDNGGIMWGVNTWHKFRLVRDVATGDIAVFMDANLTTMPILTTTDTTFTEGYVGFGTHQDSGRIRNLKVWGRSATALPAPANFFTAR